MRRMPHQRTRRWGCSAKRVLWIQHAGREYNAPSTERSVRPQTGELVQRNLMTKRPRRYSSRLKWLTSTRLRHAANKPKYYGGTSIPARAFLEVASVRANGRKESLAWLAYCNTQMVWHENSVNLEVEAIKETRPSVCPRRKLMREPFHACVNALWPLCGPNR